MEFFSPLKFPTSEISFRLNYLAENQDLLMSVKLGLKSIN